MQPRLNLVTLGVSNLSRSRIFYEKWGWIASAASQPGVVFFQANGLALALFGRSDLAEDAGIQDVEPAGFSAITLAYNTHSKEEADMVYSRAVAAGATPVKPLREFFGAAMLVISQIQMVISGRWPGIRFFRLMTRGTCFCRNQRKNSSKTRNE